MDELQELRDRDAAKEIEILRDKLTKAEDQVARLTALADRLASRIAAVEDQVAALDELAVPEVTPSEDMRAAFALAARGVRAALATQAGCDPLDDNQDHHDWDYETHGGSLGVCKQCGALSQGWEE